MDGMKVCRLRLIDICKYRRRTSANLKSQADLHALMIQGLLGTRLKALMQACQQC